MTEAQLNISEKLRSIQNQTNSLDWQEISEEMKEFGCRGLNPHTIKNYLFGNVPNRTDKIHSATIVYRLALAKIENRNRMVAELKQAS